MKRGVRQGNLLQVIPHQPLLEAGPFKGFTVLDMLDNILIMKLTNWVIERRLGICLDLISRQLGIQSRSSWKGSRDE